MADYTIQVEVSEPMSSSGIPYMNVVEVLLIGAEII